MKEQDSIPTSKVQRASRFLKTGAKVGRNYLKHYAKKAFNSDHTREELNRENAEDIYESLSELKGSALKVAQMMSMDSNVLPQAYIDKFTEAQYKAPPLSYPLVVKTFRKYFGKSPNEVFEDFSQSAANAASMGQVHHGVLDGRKVAVKIQYPGVAESLQSDLRMVKPLASRILNINLKEFEVYVKEVEERLMEETDYELELERSLRFSEACRNLENLEFPEYFPEYSNERIITMSWLRGEHLDEFLLSNPDQATRDKIGQAIWDFYDYQVHTLREVHADPHPGNFLFREDGSVGIIDFGCVKTIPDEFYTPFFELLDPEIMNDQERMLRIFHELEFLIESDTDKEKELFIPVFKEMIGLLGRPFHAKEFDFGDDAYFKEIAETGERIGRDKEFRKQNQARGSRHGIYLNRTYFGLYNILHLLRAKIKTTRKNWEELVPAI